VEVVLVAAAAAVAEPLAGAGVLVEGPAGEGALAQAGVGRQLAGGQLGCDWRGDDWREDDWRGDDWREDDWRGDGPVSASSQARVLRVEVVLVAAAAAVAEPLAGAGVLVEGPAGEVALADSWIDRLTAGVCLGMGPFWIMIAYAALVIWKRWSGTIGNKGITDASQATPAAICRTVIDDFVMRHCFLNLCDMGHTFVWDLIRIVVVVSFV